MDKSDNLELPYIMPNQAQKHVTHNEAIRHLDALVQISIITRGLNVPPEAPQAGSRYIVADNAEGNWVGNKNCIAVFQDGAWAFYKPQVGWLAWVQDESIILVFQGDKWDPLQSNTNELQAVELLGINTTATTESRFGVATNDSYFSHEGSSHRLSINKSSQSDTGSLIYKTNWIGHAEMGLTGNNNFSIKVTSDGENWSDSLVLDAESGKVSFPSGLLNSHPHGVPETLDDYDIVYMDSISGNDTNDGTSLLSPIKTIERLEKIFTVGRRLQIRLLSDIVWNHVIRLNYPVNLLEIVGRKSDDSGAENRTISVEDSRNISNLPGGLQMRCISSVFLHSINVDLNTAKGQSFINFTSTMGYLRTYKTTLKRFGSGSCCLFADGSSFVASRHQLMTIDDSAKGYVAQGVSAGENPNDDWRYASSLNEF